MIKHIVMWKLLEAAAGNSKAQNAQLAKAKLEVGIDFSIYESDSQ